MNATHWNQIWRDFVTVIGVQYTIKQCQDKIIIIKYKWKEELEVKKANGGENFEWHYFDLVNRIWRKTPKQTRIPNK